MEELLDSLSFKNHERFQAVEVKDVKQDPNPRKGEEHYRACAESHFSVLRKAIENNEFPIIIFEDDIDVEKSAYNPVLNIEENVDAIYLGTSWGDGRYSARNIGNNFNRIQRVFATHAILYMNKEIAEFTIAVGKWWIYSRNRAFDIGLAYNVQPVSYVIAPHRPMFYQSDAKNTKNKWEHITRTPLSPINHLKFPEQLTI